MLAAALAAGQALLVLGPHGGNGCGRGWRGRIGTGAAHLRRSSWVYFFLCRRGGGLAGELDAAHAGGDGAAGKAVQPVVVGLGRELRPLADFLTAAPAFGLGPGLAGGDVLGEQLVLAVVAEDQQGARIDAHAAGRRVYMPGATSRRSWTNDFQ